MRWNEQLRRPKCKQMQQVGPLIIIMKMMPRSKGRALYTSSKVNSSNMIVYGDVARRKFRGSI